MRMSSVKDADKHGKYYVTLHPSGSRTIRYRGGRDKGDFVPSDDKLRQRVLEEEKSGRLTRSAYTMLSNRGIIEVGRRDANAARKALGLPIKRDMPWKERKQQIERAIAAFWPEEDVQRALRDKEVELGKISGFIEKYSSEANEAMRWYRKHGWSDGLRKMIDRVRPGVYRLVHRKHHVAKIDKDALGDFVFDRWTKNLTNERTYVAKHGTPEEKKNVGKIAFLAGKNGMSYLRMAAKLTKRLGYRDVAMSGSGRRQRDILAENFTFFVFSWGKFIEIPGLVENPYVIRDRESVEFTYDVDKKTGRADLRVNGSDGNQPVEVKTAVYKVPDKIVTEVLSKYSNGNHWKTGEKMDSPIAVLHMLPEFDCGAKERLTKGGISVITADQFSKYLRNTLDVIANQYIDFVRAVRPRIHDLESIARAYHNLIHEPMLLAHYGNVDIQNQLNETLISLGSMGRKLRNGS